MAKDSSAPAPSRRKKASNAPDVVPPPALPDDPKQRALLAALWADPEADEPRLVYADYLLERGDPRGAYIQAVLKSWSTATTLFRKHEKEWLAPIRPYIRTWKWSRGFVSRVTCDAGLFVEGAEAICAASPDLWVTITGLAPQHIPGLAAAPLGKLRSLSFSSQRIDDAQAQILLPSPTLAGLRELILGSNDLGPAAMQALASSPVRTSLRWLALDRNPLGDDGAIALAGSPGFPELRRLDVGDCELTEKGVLALVRSKTFPKSLRAQFGLQSFPLTDEAKRELLARFPDSLG